MKKIFFATPYDLRARRRIYKTDTCTSTTLRNEETYMKKKLIAIVLACVTVFSLSASAFAYHGSGKNCTQTNCTRTGTHSHSGTHSRGHRGGGHHA